jgi:hypothetical protein
MLCSNTLPCACGWTIKSRDKSFSGCPEELHPRWPSISGHSFLPPVSERRDEGRGVQTLLIISADRYDRIKEPDLKKRLSVDYMFKTAELNGAVSQSAQRTDWCANVPGRAI